MSLMKYVKRLKRMDDLIRRKATGKAEEFARKLGVSRSQLLQDLKELREEGAPIEFDTYQQTYYYSRDYILSPGFLVDGRYIRGGSVFHLDRILLFELDCNIYQFEHNPRK